MDSLVSTLLVKRNLNKMSREGSSQSLNQLFRRSLMNSISTFHHLTPLNKSRTFLISGQQTSNLPRKNKTNQL